MSRKSNVDDSPGAIVVYYNLYEEVNLFDSLPKSWKDVINNAPTVLPICTLKEILDYQGEEKGLPLVIAALQKDYPGWKPDWGYPKKFKTRKKNR